MSPELIPMIHTVKGFQVMLDRDLAELYQTETRSLKQAVKRNLSRFPSDYMFELTDNEVQLMVSQFVIPSKSHFGGSNPFTHVNSICRFWLQQIFWSFRLLKMETTVAPVSAITHYAEIASIEKWSDTNKYILKFKEAAKAIGPISLDKEMGKKGLAPQAPRYTSFDKLLKAKKLSQVF